MSVKPEVLARIRDGQSIEDLVKKPVSYINRLVKEGLVKDTPRGLELTPKAAALLVEEKWRVQQYEERFNQDDLRVAHWITTCDHAGTPVDFSTQQAAERDAALRSVQANKAFRVIHAGTAPDMFTVYLFGERYTEDQVTGGRIKTPVVLPDAIDDTPLIESIPYIIQKRLIHSRNNFVIAAWESAIDRLYFDMDEAKAAVSELSSKDTDAYEYRIWYDGIEELPFVVWCRGQVSPDIGILDSLADEGARLLDNPDRHQRKLEAVVHLLRTWASQDDIQHIADLLSVAD